MTTTPAADSVLLLSLSTLPRWRLLLQILLRPIWPSSSRLCSREKSRVSIRFWCIRCPSLPKSSHYLHVHPPSFFQVLWKHFALSDCSYFHIPCYQISVQGCHHAQFSLLSLSVALPSCAAMSSSLCQLTWNAPSRWDHPLTLHLVDICAAFPSQSSIHQKDFQETFLLEQWYQKTNKN